MLQDTLKRLIRLGLSMVVWVFVLSIQIQGDSIFNHLHGTLVENKLVRAVDEELATLWFNLKESTSAAFNQSELRETERTEF